MTKQWSLNLRILDPSGRPVGMAAVGITKSPLPAPDIAALSGSDGNVSIEAPSGGAYGMSINAPGFAQKNLAVAAVTSDTVTEVRLSKLK